MRSIIRSICLGLSLSITAPTVIAGDEILVYSSRNKSYIQPLFDEYSRETGISIAYVICSANALISRLQVEGDQSKADLFITSDAANLSYAAASGVLAPIESRTLNRNVPEHLKAPDNSWFSLSKRARTIVYHSERVDPDQLDSYAALADPQWKGKLCLRSASDEYTQSLVAMLIKRLGEKKTEDVVKGWADNLATKPFRDDSHIIDALRAGQCDVSIINSYYYARVQHEQPQTKLKLFWADQSGDGVHMNVTGAGVTAYAPNKEEAVYFLEWLTTRKVQVKYTKLNMEYPVNPKVYPPRMVGRWGRFKEDTANIAEAGRLQEEAIAILSRVNHL